MDSPGTSSLLCGWHNEPVTRYCGGCRLFHCKECKCDRGGMSLQDLVEEVEKRFGIDFKDQVTFPLLAKQFGPEYKQLADSERKAAQENLEVDIEAAQQDYIEKHKEEVQHQDIKLLKGLSVELTAGFERARSKKLQLALEKAIRKTELYAEPNRHIMNVHTTDSSEVNAGHSDKTLKCLRNQLDMMDLVLSSDLANPPSLEAMAVVSFKLLDGRVSGPSKVKRGDTSVSSFCAFNGANLYAELHSGLERVSSPPGGCGVSTLSKLCVQPRGGDFYVCASLSHKGVLAVCSLLGKTYGVEFMSLATDQRRTMELNDKSSVAFYDDSFILLTYRHQLMRGCVTQIFTDDGDDSLVEVGGVIPEGGVNYITETTTLHESRLLYYTDYCNRPFVFNVDTLENKRLCYLKNNGTFVSLTGIFPGYRAAFIQGEMLELIPFGIDNEVKKLELGGSSSVQTIFPSTYNYKNVDGVGILLAKGVMIVRTQKDDDMSKMLKGFHLRSLVRLHGDVFIGLSQNEGEGWVLLSIQIK